MSSYKNFVKPGTPVLQSTHVLDPLRERIRYMHYSLSTEQVYVYWVRFFIRWSGNGGAMRHPRDMGASEVESFLTHLATDRKVSASTHNQALSAILFLYREVLAVELPWLNGINRPTKKRRIPSVLIKDEVARLLAQMDGQTALIARLLYGIGMRLMEGMRLRIKDVDFDRHVIIVRDAKGGKDRVVMLPRSLVPALRLQLLAARALWEADRTVQRGGVETPHARRRSTPKWATHGLGSGCFRHPLCQSILEVAWSGVIICMKTGFSAHSRRPSRWLASASRCLFTRCAIRLLRTCCSRVPTFARCKNCSVTPLAQTSCQKCDHDPGKHLGCQRSENQVKTASSAIRISAISYQN